MRTIFRRGAFALLLLWLLAALVGCGAAEQTRSGGRVIAGGDVTLRPGEAAGGLLILGGNVVIPEDVRVEGDMAMAGGNVRLDGVITGNVAIMGGALSGAGEVLGEVAAVGGSVSLPNIAAAPAEPAPPAEPPAPPEPPEPPVVDGRPERPPSMLDRLFGFIGSVVGALVQAVAFGAMGLIVALFLPKPLQRTRAAAEADPLPAMGVGCLSIPVVGTVAFFFAIIIIGLPITAALALVMMVMALLGWLAIGSLLGERLLKWADVRRPQFAATAAIGAAALSLAGSLLGNVPVIGGLMVGFLWLWGIGAALLTFGGTRDYRPAHAVAGAAPGPQVRAPYAPPAERPSARDLYADLAADLGLDERDLRGPDDPTAERPVPPPDR